MNFNYSNEKYDTFINDTMIKANHIATNQIGELFKKVSATTNKDTITSLKLELKIFFRIKFATGNVKYPTVFLKLMVLQKTLPLNQVLMNTSVNFTPKTPLLKMNMKYLSFCANPT